MSTDNPRLWITTILSSLGMTIAGLAWLFSLSTQVALNTQESTHSAEMRATIRTEVVEYLDKIDRRLEKIEDRLNSSP